MAARLLIIIGASVLPIGQTPLCVRSGEGCGLEGPREAVALHIYAPLVVGYRNGVSGKDVGVFEGQALLDFCIVVGLT